MGRRRSYTAKSNRNNLLGTFIHNWAVDNEKRAKNEAASRKKIAAMRERQRRREGKLRAIEAERNLRAEERARKKKIRDSREAEKNRVRLTKAQERKKKRQQKINDRFLKYVARLELYCRKHGLDPVCVEEMAEEAQRASLRLGKELENLIILGREEEWTHRGEVLQKEVYAEGLISIVKSIIEKKNYIDHINITKLIESYMDELNTHSISLVDIEFSEITKKYMSKLTLEDEYLSYLFDNFEKILIVLKINKSLKEEFLHEIIDSHIKVPEIKTSSITQKFSNISMEINYNIYVEYLNNTIETLVEDNIIMFRDKGDIFNLVMDSNIPVNEIKTSEAILKFSEKRSLYDSELDERLLEHIS